MIRQFTLIEMIIKTIQFLFFLISKTNFKHKNNNNKIHSILIILIASSITKIYSQTQFVSYMLNYEHSNPKIITLKSEGCVFFYNTSTFNAQKPAFTFIKLDTNLKEMWQSEFQLSKEVDYINYSINNQVLNILFYKESYYEVIQINIITGEIFSTKGYTPYKNCLIEDFSVTNNYAYLGGSIPPSDNKVIFRTALSFIFFPLIFFPNFIPERVAFASQIDLNTGSTKQFAFNYKGFSNLTDIFNDTLNGKSYFFIKNKIGKAHNLHMQEISMNGVKSKSIPISPISKKHQLLTGKFHVSKSGQKMVIGTYSINKTDGAQGLYFSGFENTKQDFIVYNSFTNFNKFFNYLSVNQRHRIEDEIKLKKKAGKNLLLDYQLLVHDILESNHSFKMVAEAYFATYRTEFRTIWIYGRPVSQPFNVFDGWKYSHAIVACFDSNGKLLWDDWISIPNTTSYVLEEKVKIFNIDNYIKLTTFHNNNLSVKNIDELNIERKLDTLQEIFTIQSSPLETNLDFWYDNFAISMTVTTQKKDDIQNKSFYNVIIKKHNYLNFK